MSREELCKLQSEDDELKAFSEKKDLTKHGEFEVKFENVKEFFTGFAARLMDYEKRGSKLWFLL